MSFSDIISVSGLIVGIIGVVVGIIGCLALSKANKLNAKKIDNSTINQAETLIVQNGLDFYAVIKVAQDTTKEELKGITETLSATTLDLDKLKKELDSISRIHVGTEEPPNLKKGDFFFQITDQQ